MDFKQRLGSRIKTTRLSKGLKSKFVAEKLNISATQYSLLEKGEVTVTAERLNQLAEIFGVEINIFFANELSETLSEVI